jgi:exopolysaccharide biosynthesis protein
MLCRRRFHLILAIILSTSAALLHAAEKVTHPFEGITYIVRSAASPRKLTMHIVKIDLRAPGIRFEVTPPGGSLETLRSTTLDFLKHEHAQVAINAHFFLPFPSDRAEANLVGFAVSNGHVYSAFENPEQSYAIVDEAPAVNIDPSNRAAIVHDDDRFPDGKHVKEKVELWNAVAGSAQIITDGVATVPQYRDAKHPGALLKPGGPTAFSNRQSWYDKLRARTVIGLSRDNQTMLLFTVDAAGGSLGMKVSEVADLLIRDFGVYNAINLDGGGSTSMAMENPVTHVDELVNISSDKATGRTVGSSLVVFAKPSP